MELLERLQPVQELHAGSVEMTRIPVALLLAVAAALAANAPNGKIAGKQSAPIRLELFSDFSCPGCKHFHDDILPIVMREFITPGKAYLVFRDYVLPPLPGHQFSGEAARFAVAANKVGKYRAVADALFASQSSWAFSGQIWPVVASVLTPDEQKRVLALSKEQAVADEVKSDTDAGNRAGLTRTPTVGINFKTQRRLWNQFGTPETDALFLDYLRALLKK
jgi:protein-disulfide isomerase